MLIRDKETNKLVNITKKDIHTNSNYYKTIIFCKYKEIIDEKHKDQLLNLLK